MTAHDRFNDLFSRVHYLATATLHGDATADEVRELEQIVLESDAALKAYVDFIEVYQSLQAWAAVESDEWLVEQRAQHAATDGDNEKTTPRSYWVSRALKHPHALSLVGAAVVMGLLIAAMWFMAPPYYRSIMNEHEQEPPAAPPRIVGQLTELHRAVFEKGQTLASGNLLREGGQIQLQAGLAELTYGSGARVILEGPCQYIVSGEGRGNLKVGKLTAHVPPEAVGFSIDTPVARLVDLGTEFGTRVDPTGGVDAVCITGLVEVTAANVKQPKRLHKGEAIRIHADGRFSIRRPNVTQVQFVRTIPPADPKTADVINVDIENAGNDTYVGRGAYRAASGDFWNSLSKIGEPSQPLKTSSEKPTRVVVELQNGSFTRTIYNDTGHALTDDYLVTKDAQGEFVIRGLRPHQPYDLVLYGTCGVSSNSQDKIGKGTAEGTMFTISGVTKVTAGLRQGDVRWRNGKDYAAFLAVQADDRGEIAGTWTNNPAANAPFNSNPYGIFNGLQIIGDFSAKKRGSASD